MSEDSSPEAREIKYTGLLGFRFNPEEEYRMYLACLAASRFMETYGSGRKPYLIDLSHYETAITEGED